MYNYRWFLAVLLNLLSLSSYLLLWLARRGYRLFSATKRRRRKQVNLRCLALLDTPCQA